MIIRHLARPMLASVFVAGGADALRDPEPRADLAEPVVDALVETAQAANAPVPLWETEQFVRANAAVQVGAGLLLATGKLPRLASAALAASLVPTTLGGHRFWEHEGAERKVQQLQFFKNVALTGGLVLAAVDTEGKPGLTSRARRAKTDAAHAKQLAAAEARARTAEAKTKAALARAHLVEAAGKKAVGAATSAAGTAASGLRDAITS